MPELQDKRIAINREIRDKILARMSQAGSHATDIPGFRLVRRESGNELRVFYKPFIGLTVQGSKRTIIGDEEYAYGAYHVFVTGVDMPSESHILNASPRDPFLALSLDLDRTLVAQLAAEALAVQEAGRCAGKSVAIVEADEKLMAAFLRLLDLLDEPSEIPIMAPLLVREIHLRLLLGPQGQWLRSICSLDSPGNQIAKAITWLREHFREPLSVDELAAQTGMSPSTFYRNFKSITTYSPLNFQKSLRLYEAQRLMLADVKSVADASFSVGYESSTQFIREYRRIFGESPKRDISRRLKALKQLT